MVGIGMGEGSGHAPFSPRLSASSSQSPDRYPSPPRRSPRKGAGIIRRLLLRAALLGAIWGVAAWQFPHEFDSGSWAVRNFFHQTFYKMEMHFVGLQRLRAEDLEVLLPSDRPFWWWLVSAPALEKELAQNSLVKTAAVNRCSWSSLRCFEIQVQEREPVVLVSLQGTWWLMGDDGGMIGPVSDEGRSRSSLPTISGVARFENTPQVLRERLLVVLPLLKSFSARQSESGSAITTVSFLSDTEILLSFDKTIPEVLLDISTADGVQEQLRRLNEVQAQLGDRLANVRRIDLAFDAQAVVTFKDPVPAGVSEGTKSAGPSPKTATKTPTVSRASPPSKPVKKGR